MSLLYGWVIVGDVVIAGQGRKLDSLDGVLVREVNKGRRQKTGRKIKRSEEEKVNFAILNIYYFVSIKCIPYIYNSSDCEASAVWGSVVQLNANNYNT